MSRSIHARAAVPESAAVAVLPFEHSLDHVLAELARVDLAIRARVAVLRRQQAQDEHFRGLYVSEEEVDGLLARALGRPSWMSGDTAWLAAADASLQAHGEAVEARRQATIERGRPLALDRLRAAFDLERIDLEILLVALAVELDLRYEKLYAYLQDDVTRKRPSVELVSQLLAGELVGAFAIRGRLHETAPLVARHLVHLVEDASQTRAPMLARYVTIDARVVRFLLAQDVEQANALEPLPAGVALADGPDELDALLLDDGLRAALAEANWDGAANGPARRPVVLLRVPAAAAGDARRVAAASCRERGLPMLVVDAATLPAHERGGDAAAGIERDAGWLAALEREAGLRGAAVFWQGLEPAHGESGPGDVEGLLRAIDASRAPALVVDVPSHVRRLAFPMRGVVRLDLARPSAAHRQAAWGSALRDRPLDADVDLEAVAARFRLALSEVPPAAAEAAQLARRRAGPAGRVSQADVLDACRRHSSQRLGALARKVSMRAFWTDIVLPADRMALLRELCNHMRFRERVYTGWGFGAKLALGKGLAALFAGPSGTGKTLAASVIAGELGLDLYKIDLASVISKYIGETEKNLARIFEEAEQTDAILFFDEADALFGKRSEVRDSHDRYANIEVGYLLQRMEEYDGMAILATNNRRNMDDAFLRRLQFTIEFPVPDVEQRLSIWRGIWPRAVPRDPALDLQAIAQRYELSGGSIRNVAVAAAFLAIAEGDAGGEAGREPNVRHEHVIRAIQREYQKSGRLMREDEALLLDEPSAG